VQTQAVPNAGGATRKAERGFDTQLRLEPSIVKLTGAVLHFLFPSAYAPSD
jgi:hypothetical protein